MRSLLLISFLVTGSFLYSQTTIQGWFSAEGSRKFLDKKLTTSAELNARFDKFSQLDKFFPSVTVKYKVTKWFKPGIEYRYIVGRNKWGNYPGGHRLNFNGNLVKDFDKFKVKLRGRYQYSFDAFGSTENYQPEFDNAFRVKPSVVINLKGDYTPYVNAEWFYSMRNAPLGRRINKFRTAVGTDIKLSKKHSIDVKYMFDTELNVPNPERRHILGVSYGFNWK